MVNKRCKSVYQQADENVSKVKGLKIIGSMAELIDRVLMSPTHAGTSVLEMHCRR